MFKNINSISLVSLSLKDKLRVSFCLMSIVPLLVCIYLVSNYIFPRLGIQIDITSIIFISVFIAIIGFFLIKEVFDRIVSISIEAKLIAAGDISRKLEIKHSDEVGQLSEALNELTQRIRIHMDELKNFSTKTTEINIEIQKRVIVLSSLLQISSLVSQGAKLDDILQIATEKSRFLVSADIAYLLFREENEDNFNMKVADGLNSHYLLKITLESKADFLEKVINTGGPLILDEDHMPSSKFASNFYEKFKFKNTLAIPIYLRGKIKAILGVGSTKEYFSFKKDDMELLDILAKQIAIAVENDILMHRVEKLEIKDALTGLYNQAFIQNRLEEEIKRAVTYQRPCSFILFDIDNFKKFSQSLGSLASESTLKRIGSLIRDSVTEIDRVGRIGDDEFAIVMPEKNKRQAQGIADVIRRKVEFIFSEEPDLNKKITVSGGVSENPLDGIDAIELMNAAKESLNIAKKQGKNRISSSRELTR
jgi:diguanylate cyclase (GGDEF)-like protein